MEIASIRIQNFRSFADTTMSLSDYTCLVGPNGAGKSTVLTALNVFFRESENVSTDVNRLDIEDFHLKRTGDPVRITVTFTGLSEKAEEDFSDYVRQGQLIVSAEAIFDEATGNAEVKQYGQRRAMLPFAPYFAALGDNKQVAELQEIYNELRATYPDLPTVSTKAAMTNALHDYEAQRPDECELIPIEDQFYGFSKGAGANHLAKHIQWVYVPAVMDATSEQVEARNSALGKLLARTVRSKTNFDQTVSALRTDMQERYQTLLNGSQDALGEVSRSLQGRLSKWAHPDATVRLEWQQDPDKSVRVDEPLAHIVLAISANQSKGHADIPNQGVRHVFRSNPAYRLLWYQHGLARLPLRLPRRETAPLRLPPHPGLLLPHSPPLLRQSAKGSRSGLFPRTSSLSPTASASQVVNLPP